jgi:hypothetical protein
MGNDEFILSPGFQITYFQYYITSGTDTALARNMLVMYITGWGMSY